MIKHLGINWFRLAFGGIGIINAPGYREERLSERARRLPTYV